MKRGLSSQQLLKKSLKTDQAQIKQTQAGRRMPRPCEAQDKTGAVMVPVPAEIRCQK